MEKPRRGSRKPAPTKITTVLSVDEAFLGTLKVASLRQAVGCALQAAGIRQPVEVSVRVADDETVRALNRRYRGKDAVTDVLSFALAEEVESGPFVLPPDGVRHLGEVAISYPQARRQSGEYGTTPEQEVAFLVIHGVLHLLGYDHERTERERRKMRALEQRALDLVGATMPARS